MHTHAYHTHSYTMVRNESVLAEFQEWSEEESEEDDSQQPISREDSGIQLDRTPQEDQDNSNKTIPVTWTGLV